MFYIKPCNNVTLLWYRTQVSPLSLKFLHSVLFLMTHDDVIKWKHFPRYWPFVRGIHWSPVNSPHKGQWRGALMFPLICAWINRWVNNGEAGDFRRYSAHYDVIIMYCKLVEKCLHYHSSCSFNHCLFLMTIVNLLKICDLGLHLGMKYVHYMEGDFFFSNLINACELLQ